MVDSFCDDLSTFFDGESMKAIFDFLFKMVESFRTQMDTMLPMRSPSMKDPIALPAITVAVALPFCEGASHNSVYKKISIVSG